MTPRWIFGQACEFYGISTIKGLSGRRTRVYTLARCMAINLSLELTLFSLVDIGDNLGICHTTVINARNRHPEHLHGTRHYERDYLALRARLRELIDAEPGGANA